MSIEEELEDLENLDDLEEEELEEAEISEEEFEEGDEVAVEEEGEVFVGEFKGVKKGKARVKIQGQRKYLRCAPGDLFDPEELKEEEEEPVEQEEEPEGEDLVYGQTTDLSKKQVDKLLQLKEEANEEGDDKAGSKIRRTLRNHGFYISKMKGYTPFEKSKKKKKS